MIDKYTYFNLVNRLQINNKNIDTELECYENRNGFINLDLIDKTKQYHICLTGGESRFEKFLSNSNEILDNVVILRVSWVSLFSHTNKYGFAKIKSIFPNLQRLILNHCEIQNINDLDILSECNVIDLSSNFISNVPPSYWDMIEKVNLFDNTITYENLFITMLEKRING